MGQPLPAAMAPMLATAGPVPAGPRGSWGFEFKWDGVRAVVRVEPRGGVRVLSRSGHHMTGSYPELTRLAEQLPAPVLLDGELVVLDDHGRPSFRLHQQRMHVRAPSPGLLRDVPVQFYAFDLLHHAGEPLLDRPYEQRRAVLDTLAGAAAGGPMRIPPYYVDVAGEQLLEVAREHGLEGVVAKRLSSRYVPGTVSRHWVKTVLRVTQEVVVGGWHPGHGRYAGTLGGLLVGVHDEADGRLRYVGSVGTGFSDRDRDHLHALLTGRARPDSPFDDPVPPVEARDAHWVAPDLVGEVQHREWLRPDGRLRAPSWRGLRTDLSPADVHAPFLADTTGTAERSTANRVTVRVADRRLTLSNLDKVLYPAANFTKADVIDYYHRIAPVLLPLLKDRPVTFIRYPDGVDGERFFEKNVPQHAPDWVHTVRLPSSGSRGGGEHIDYVLIDDLPTLVWAANLAALELHIPQWTIDPHGRRPPDRLVFDLDPGPDATIVECCRVAERLHHLLTADRLTPVAKTSGSKGLQLYAGIHTTEAKRPSAYSKALAERLAAETPDLVVAKMPRSLRHRKVFIDWSQNNPAKTTVAPYSLRGRTRPTVSTPVTWAEVRACHQPEQLTFTATDVLTRVDRIGDLFINVADLRAELPG